MSNAYWSEEQPTKPGFYWYYDTGLDQAQIMRVYMSGLPQKLWAEGGELLFPLELDKSEFEDCVHNKEWWSKDPIAVPNVPYVDFECTCKMCED